MGLFMCFGRVSGVGRNNNVCLIEAKKDVVEKIVSGSQDWWEDWRARPETLHPDPRAGPGGVSCGHHCCSRTASKGHCRRCCPKPNPPGRPLLPKSSQSRFLASRASCEARPLIGQTLVT